MSVIFHDFTVLLILDKFPLLFQFFNALRYFIYYLAKIGKLLLISKFFPQKVQKTGNFLKNS